MLPTPRHPDLGDLGKAKESTFSTHSKAEVISWTKNSEVDDLIVLFQPWHSLNCQIWGPGGSEKMLAAQKFCLGNVATKEYHMAGGRDWSGRAMFTVPLRASWIELDLGRPQLSHRRQNWEPPLASCPSQAELVTLPFAPFRCSKQMLHTENTSDPVLN